MYYWSTVFIYSICISTGYEYRINENSCIYVKVDVYNAWPQALSTDWFLGDLTHLICSVLRWKLRASTSTFSVNGGLSPLRWRSKWAELERAWTPVSVLLEMYRDTGLTGLSLLIASCKQRTPEGLHVSLLLGSKCTIISQSRCFGSRKINEKLWQKWNSDVWRLRQNISKMPGLGGGWLLVCGLYLPKVI